MKLKQRTIYLFLTLSVSLVALIVTLQLSDRSQDIRERAASADDPTISLTASSASVQFGQPVDISVVITNTAAKSIVGTDVSLNFDRTRLTLNSITPITTHNLKTFVPLNANNVFDGSSSSPIVASANSTGTLVFGAIAYNQSTSAIQTPQTATFTLATLHFTAKALSGPANLSFNAIANSTIDTNIAVENVSTDSLRSATGIGIILVAPPTSTPTPIPAEAPGLFNLLSPINNVYLDPTQNITLQWSASADATSYDWYIYHSGGIVLKSGSTTETSVTTTLMVTDEYGWYVIAKNALGTRKSALNEFNTVLRKIKPANYEQVLFGSTYTFEWVPFDTKYENVIVLIYPPPPKTLNDLMYYKLFPDETNEYKSGKFSIPLTATSSMGAIKFEAGKSYLWQIRAQSGMYQPITNTLSEPHQFTLVTTLPTATPTQTPTPVPPTVTPIPPTPIPPTPTNTPTPTVTTIPATLTPTRTPTPTPVPYSCSATVPAFTSGNANCDALINTIDFVIWLNAFRGGSVTPYNADFDQNGAINTLDFIRWLNGFSSK